MLRCSRRLRDLVPVVLHRPSPEPANLRLLCRTAGTGNEPQGFAFIEGRGIRVAGQWWRRARTKFSARTRVKGVMSGQCVNTGGGKLGGVTWYAPGSVPGTKGS